MRKYAVELLDKEYDDLPEEKNYHKVAEFNRSSEAYEKMIDMLENDECGDAKIILVIELTKDKENDEWEEKTSIACVCDLGHTKEQQLSLLKEQYLEMHNDELLENIKDICNMKKVCKLANVSYDSYKAYSCGRYKLSKEIKNKLIYTVKEYLS